MAETTARPSPKIEDYALIGDFRTAALVSNEGSIDWLCVPRFDSGACFAKLVGDESNGFWRISPVGKFSTERRYRPDTLILETTFHTADGSVQLVDCMLPNFEVPTVLRVVKGLGGRVKMRMELVIRFDYGSVVPWVTRNPFGGIEAIAGSDMLRVRTTKTLYGKEMRTFSDFEVEANETVPFLLTWTPSHQETPPEINNPQGQLERLSIWWQDWIRQCRYEGPHKEVVKRSLITLKALTYEPTGGIIAAPTTSLPEEIGGVRNWDYRYCWLRDATITLRALLLGGYREEALAWRDWLLRAVAGTPSQINIMYGIGGERRLNEEVIPWLSGYENSSPVRVGNGAFRQCQMDIFGGLLDCFSIGRENGLAYKGPAWRIERKIVEFLERNWKNPDRGIWEVRGEPRHFTQSKVMCWVAMDRAIKSQREMNGNGEAARWEALATEIREDVLKNGYNPDVASFVQSYGSRNLDASTLLLPATGFIKATDPRMLNTVTAIERDLMRDGFVLRYTPEHTDDGLPGKEGAFLACSAWLVDNYLMQGQREKAERLFDKILNLQNDVGLFSEEYDVENKRFVGNFPQAFTHVAVINTAFNVAAKF